METTNAAIRRAKEKAEDLIRDITRKEHISPAELEAVMKSVCLIMKVEGVNGGNDEGYNYDNGFSEGSYRRGRSSVTGQYVSRDSSHRYYDGGSRNSGYSGHSIQDRMIAKLEDMYDEAHTEHERQVVQDWINRLSR